MGNKKAQKRQREEETKKIDISDDPFSISPGKISEYKANFYNNNTNKKISLLFELKLPNGYTLYIEKNN